MGDGRWKRRTKERVGGSGALCVIYVFVIYVKKRMLKEKAFWSSIKLDKATLEFRKMGKKVLEFRKIGQSHSRVP
jgi:hypothetical protein